MADEERARAAVRGAERFLNAWHGRPAARGRLLEISDAIDKEERFDRCGESDELRDLYAEVLARAAGPR